MRGLENPCQEPYGFSLFQKKHDSMLQISSMNANTMASEHKHRKSTAKRRDDEGGLGDLYANVMPMAEGLSALNDKNYAPAAAAARVASLANAAQNALDAGFAPSPFGPSHPDLTRDSGESEPYVRNPNLAVKTHTNTHGREVVLKANSMHAYLAKGFINSKAVEFLVDTGATNVSIPYRIADFLGLIPIGRAQKAQTANGVASIYETRVEHLTLGDIEFHNIRASINLGDKSDQILLGMSVLKELEIQLKDGMLWLRQKN